MTRTLVLTRHAKSSWSTAGLLDHDRPLTKRGRTAAMDVGAWLQRHGWIPDEVLSSTSKRTRETWDRMALNAPSVCFLPALYHARADQMLKVLQTARGHIVLMLGHNPGIAEFAARLAQTAPDHPRFFDYPTCATTVMTFDLADWSQLRPHLGRVASFVIPRELPE